MTLKFLEGQNKALSNSFLAHLSTVFYNDTIFSHYVRMPLKLTQGHFYTIERLSEFLKSDHLI